MAGMEDVGYKLKSATALSRAWLLPIFRLYNHGLPLAGATLWVRQLAMRLGCERLQPSRWLSRLRGERSEGSGAGLTLFLL